MRGALPSHCSYFGPHLGTLVPIWGLPHGDQIQYFGPHFFSLQIPHFLYFRLKNELKSRAATI